MKIFLTLLLLSLLKFRSSSASSNGVHWTHEEPMKWGGVCTTHDRQHRQSPIDIESLIPYDTTTFVFKNYGFINTTQKNNGHALNILLHPGHTENLPKEHEEEEEGADAREANKGEEMEAGERGDQDFRPQVSGGGLPGTYILDSFHFHWGSDSFKGSEHLLQGCAFAGEMHLVHYKKEFGSVQEALKHPHGLAVLGIWLSPSHVRTHHSHLDVWLAASKADYFFSPGTVPMQSSCGYTQEEHELSSHHWFDMITPRDNAEIKQQPLTPVHLRQMMPFNTKNFYRYEGSLTTPPCTENVIWTIFEEAVSVPETFLEGLRHLLVPDAPTHRISNNFRPPQSISGRTVLHSGDESNCLSACKQTRDQHAACTTFPDMHYVSIGASEVEVPEDEEKRKREENCPAGHLSSPINLYLNEAEPVYSPNLRWKRISHCNGVQVVNDGYMLKVLYPTASPEWELIGSNLTSGVHLIGMQLRWGSEHHLGGRSFPLELQLIHYNSKYKNFQEAIKKSDGIVVVSKFFQEPVTVDTTVDSVEGHEAGYNKHLAGIIYAVENKAQNRFEPMRMRSPDIRHLMGDTSTYYEYRGDLGPPSHSNCVSITATWMVIRKTGHISRKQLETLKQMTFADGSPVLSNNRPLAPSNDRQVILRINSRELTHEFETMVKRMKRSPPLIVTTKASVKETNSSPPSGLSTGSIIPSLSVMVVFLTWQFRQGQFW